MTLPEFRAQQERESRAVALTCNRVSWEALLVGQGTESAAGGLWLSAKMSRNDFAREGGNLAHVRYLWRVVCPLHLQAEKGESTSSWDNWWDQAGDTSHLFLTTRVSSMWGLCVLTSLQQNRRPQPSSPSLGGELCEVLKFTVRNTVLWLCDPGGDPWASSAGCCQD